MDWTVDTDHTDHLYDHMQDTVFVSFNVTVTITTI